MNCPVCNLGLIYTNDNDLTFYFCPNVPSPESSHYFEINSLDDPSWWVLHNQNYKIIINHDKKDYRLFIFGENNNETITLPKPLKLDNILERIQLLLTFS
jgi:hypothetical protein